MSLLTPAQRLLRLRPGVFKPSLVRGITDPDGGMSTFNPESADFATTTAIGTTGSFRYDPMGSGVKTTQQLNVDWSAFENHVFFNSAQVKVNSAFNKIIDRYPFDGNRKETELFYDQLTGFENYVYQQFPKNKGYLFFSGSNVGDINGKGTFVTVKDVAGSAFPFLTKNPNGASRLDPTSSSITFQFQIYAPQTANGNQFVFQKFNTTNQHGFGCYLSQSTSPNTAQLTFFVASGSALNAMSTSIDLVKGNWTPVSFVWDRTSGVNQLRSYVSGTLYSSSDQVTINSLVFPSASLIIGSGSAMSAPLFSPLVTFSGGLDEFRYYKKILSTSEMVEYQSSSVYSAPELALYYKFNEPSGSNTQLVIDSSGQGMHGQLNPYGLSYLKVRNVATGSLFGESPMVNEDVRNCPILFPDHPDVVSLRNSLLTDATSYDNDNPNIITKLVPKQFFFYGQIQSAFDTEEGQLNELQYGSEPNTVNLGSTQTILSLLYMWASYFDEIKLFLDAFSTLRHVDYDQTDTVPDAFLKQLADFYGVELPPLFIGSDIDQFINGKNVSPDLVNSEYTLQYLQNQVWRRILININDILKSKGTVHSIKALLRAVGIEGDNIFRFKEYGGPTQRTLTALRESRNEVGSALNFAGGGYVVTPSLYGTRVEPGYPYETSTVSDGMFTSGSWTYEGIYTYAGSNTTKNTQSLARIVALDNVSLLTTSSVATYVEEEITIGPAAVLTYTYPYSTPFASMPCVVITDVSSSDGVTINTFLDGTSNSTNLVLDFSAPFRGKLTYRALHDTVPGSVRYLERTPKYPGQYIRAVASSASLNSSYVFMESFSDFLTSPTNNFFTPYDVYSLYASSVSASAITATNLNVLGFSTAPFTGEMFYLGYDDVAFNGDNVLANLYVNSGSGVTLYVQPNIVGTSALTMSVTQPDIMDGQVWNVSFGRTRGDSIGEVSSSYFLRVARNNLGSIIEEYSTSSLYDDNASGNSSSNLFQVITGSYNPLANHLEIGSGSVYIPANGMFVNQHSLQDFDGKVSQMRFWSKALTLNEWREHVRDYKSLGVNDPRVNFNFESVRSGSFEKLRGDWSTDQPTLATDTSGSIKVFDFSQHNLHATGTSFPVTSSVIVPQRFYYSFISPNFDEAVTNQKVRVRSYQSIDNVLADEGMYSVEAPAYELLQEQIPEDNGKFSIDFSIVDSLNQDMVGMFATLDVFNEILGMPNMMFSQDYPDLEVLRNVYFNRLTTKLNVKGFFDFYQWFNTNIGKFIEQLIPRKTRYNGVNYVIQSHMLERPKVEYHFEDYLLGENNRNKQKEVLLLQEFNGSLKKY